MAELHGVVVERDSHIALAIEVSLFVKRILVILLILSLSMILGSTPNMYKHSHPTTSYADFFPSLTSFSCSIICLLQLYPVSTHDHIQCSLLREIAHTIDLGRSVPAPGTSYGTRSRRCT